MLLAEQQCQADGTVIRTLRFLYDEKNSPIGFDIRVGTSTNWTSYYYAKNLQGDVVTLYAGIYVSEGVYSPSLVATYDYDPWGKILAVKDANGSTISSTNTTHAANLNPYRYRGYYYDTDTGFYYLRSRYYDPQICRFINADTYTSTGQGFLGHNMFAYCGNNPINRSDATGDFALEITVGTVICCGAALVCAFVAATALTNVIVGTIELISDNIHIAEKGAEVTEETLPQQGFVKGDPDAPPVDAGKQGKHVPGHNNYTPPEKTSDPKSAWNEGETGIKQTQEAWLNGTDDPKKPDGSVRIGTSSDGRTIRVHMGKNGAIHGYPIFLK